MYADAGCCLVWGQSQTIMLCGWFSKCFFNVLTPILEGNDYNLTSNLCQKGLQLRR